MDATAPHERVLSGRGSSHQCREAQQGKDQQCRARAGQWQVCRAGQGKLVPYLVVAHHTPHCCLCPPRSCAGHSQTQRGSHMQKWYCAAWQQAVSAAAAPAGGRWPGLGCHHMPHLSWWVCAWTDTSLCRPAQPLDKSGHLLHLPHDLQLDRQRG